MNLFHNRQHLRILKRIPGTQDFELELDNSALTTFTCPRAFELQKIIGRSAYPSVALIFGGNVHKGLDALHRTGRLDIADANLVQAFQDNPPPPDEYRDMLFARGLLRKYHEHFSNEAHLGFPIFENKGEPAVEIPFRLPAFAIEVNAEVPYPASILVQDEEDDKPTTYIGKIFVFWTGRIDLMTMKDGGVYVVDHKTSSIDSGSYWADFDLSSQMVGYKWAGEKLTGRYIAGVIINVLFIRKPTRTGKGSTFERRRFTYRQDQIDEWTHDMMDAVNQIVTNLSNGFWRKHTPVCVGKYSVCPFNPVCTKPVTQREMMLASDLYADNVWSPLHDNQPKLPESRLLAPISSGLVEGETLFTP